MVLMLPTTSDNGARLAAILPTALAALTLGAGADPAGTLTEALPDRAVRSLREAQGQRFAPEQLPPLRSVVVVVVDGLGHANLRASAGHARVLSGLPTRRIETVTPSTTGAALTTLATGRLPGEHGLIGYRIRHPEQGLVTTLKEWSGIADRRSWQLATPVFDIAAAIGARPVAIGRPAHASGGLTEAILAGAEYHGGQTIADRFAIVSRLLRGGEPLFAYLYVDELDKIAHSDGWQSTKWTNRLEQFDAALDDLLRTLPSEVGVIVTADHGVVDVPRERRLLLDRGTLPLESVAAIGGEPRLRSLYLHDGVPAAAVAEDVSEALGKFAWVGTRDEAIAAGWFGPMADGVAERLGEVLIAARGTVAFMSDSEGAAPLEMVGQHGSISDEERGVPLALGGALAGTGFAAALGKVAAAF